MERLKIVHLITRLDKGGSAENTFLSAREFVKKGHVVQIWSGKDFDIPRHTESDLLKAKIELKWFSLLVRSINPLKDFLCLIQFIQRLRQERPDILHTHTSKAGFLGRLAGVIARVPVIVHTPHGHVFYAYFGKAKTKFYIFLEKIAACWTDVLIPLSKKGMNESLKRGIGKKEQYVPVVSGIDVDSLDFSNQYRKEIRKQLGVKNQEVLIGAMGRFVPVKGFDLLVEAIAKVLVSFPGAKFYFVGDGPMRPELELRVKELNVEENVFFAPFQEISAPLQAIDVLVVPSRNEGQSRTLVEGMFLKKAAIATRVGGLPDVIENGRTGLLVAPESPAALSRALLELLNDHKKLSELGAAAAKEAKKRFNLPVMIDSLEKIYEACYQKNIDSND